jgi:hypothetical protein
MRPRFVRLTFSPSKKQLEEIYNFLHEYYEAKYIGLGYDRDYMNHKLRFSYFLKITY